MKLSSIAGTTAAIVVTLSLTTGHAAVFGSLGNFDTVNDTGKPAYGFEIDIEDPSFVMTGFSRSIPRTPALWSDSASPPSPTCPDTACE